MEKVQACKDKGAEVPLDQHIRFLPAKLCHVPEKRKKKVLIPCTQYR